MAQARHRQRGPVTARLLRAAAAAVLAGAVVGGVAVSVLVDDSAPPRLMLGIVSPGLGLLAVLAWRRDRWQSRRRTIDASGWRRDQARLEARLRADLHSQFDSELAAVQQTLALVYAQLLQARAESPGLREDIAALRAAKAAVEDALRRVTAAPAYPAFGMQAPAGFRAVEREDWICASVSALFDDDGTLLVDALAAPRGEP
jgi:hypothetical protein